MIDEERRRRKPEVRQDHSTERVRLYRDRRRRGLTPIQVDLYGDEIADLVRFGFLADAERQDKASIAEAVMRLFDRVFDALGAGELRL